MKTALLLDPVFKKHDTGPGHPESIRRYTTITRVLEEKGIPDKTLELKLRDATKDEISACHKRDYFDLAKKEITGGSHLLSTGDTHVCGDTFNVALKATGGVLNAVDAVFEKKAKNAFCAVRPPGHHATPNKGMGFCVFNSIAVGARYAQKKHGAERVAIVDWDVHHGNGTQDIFYDDGSVFFFSTHQSPWYPGTGHLNETGAGKGEGKTMNAPLAAGADMDDVGGAFKERFLKTMTEFKPDLVMISAGFDSRAGDPLGGFLLKDPDFADLTKMMMELAEKCAAGRVVSVLEGGYNVEGLAKAVTSHVETLMDN